MEETREQLKAIDPLRQKVNEMEEKDEKSQSLIKALKVDGYSWKQKALQLTELNKKLSPEELKRLEGENGRLSKQVTTMQSTIKQQGVQVTEYISELLYFLFLVYRITNKAFIIYQIKEP